MKNVEDCPCARPNEHYPYEGFMTRHKCALKVNRSGICDQETVNGCRLFERMQEDEKLREFIQGWME